MAAVADLFFTEHQRVGNRVWFSSGYISDANGDQAKNCDFPNKYRHVLVERLTIYVGSIATMVSNPQNYGVIWYRSDREAGGLLGVETGLDSRWRRGRAGELISTADVKLIVTRHDHVGFRFAELDTAGSPTMDYNVYAVGLVED